MSDIRSIIQQIQKEITTAECDLYSILAIDLGGDSAKPTLRDREIEIDRLTA
jgi:hypothetical protein